MSTPATLPWFAAHEFRLAWRDWLAMTTGGRKVRGVVLFVTLALFYLGLHVFANALLGPWISEGISIDKPTLVMITGTGFLFWTVMLSQALELVTRAYYARSDLDLILSSPASSARVFAVRTSATAFGTVLLACLLASPIINVLIAYEGPKWLAAYGVLAGLGAIAAAISVLVTIGLFRTVGPARTRLIAQIIAGIVGAGFVIGIQAVAILSFGNLNRFSVLQSPEFVAGTPELSNCLAARQGRHGRSGSHAAGAGPRLRRPRARHPPDLGRLRPARHRGRRRLRHPSAADCLHPAVPQGLAASCAAGEGMAAAAA